MKLYQFEQFTFTYGNVLPSRVNNTEVLHEYMTQRKPNHVHEDKKILCEIYRESVYCVKTLNY